MKWPGRSGEKSRSRVARHLRRGGDDDDAPQDSFEAGVRILAPGEVPDRARADVGPQGAVAPVAADAPRVVIDDDGLPDAITIDAAAEVPAASSIDPRFRERRREVQRSIGRRRVKVLIAVVGTLVVVFGALAVLASPLFSVRDVRVDGAVYLARFDAELLADVIDSLDGEPILTVDTDTARRRLETSPWVRAARVTTRLPDAALIEVREREPVAWYVGGDGANRVIDDEGVVIAVIVGIPVDYLPILGVGPDLPPGSFAGTPYRSAAQVLRALPEEIRPQVVSLGVDGAGALSLRLESGTEVVLGQPENLQSKLVALVVVLRRLGAEGGQAYAVIDLSTGEPSVR
jgi:cell division protein FtsQ